MNNRSDWRSAMAHRIGLGGQIDFTPAGVNQTLHVPCAAGHIVDVKIRAKRHPDAVAKDMLNAGWVIGSTLRCPEHRRGIKKADPAKAPGPVRRVKLEEIVTRDTIMNNASISAVSAGNGKPVGTVSDAMRQAHRMMIEMLDDAYDGAAQRYKPGWDDAKVAKESGVSTEHVAEYREMWVGPLGEPAEVTALRGEADKIMKTLEQCHATQSKALEDLGKLQGRFERLCLKHGWNVE